MAGGEQDSQRSMLTGYTRNGNQQVKRNNIQRGRHIHSTLSLSVLYTHTTTQLLGVGKEID